MQNITQILDRKIYFTEYDTSKNWIADFPNENWCLIIIADEKNKNYFDEIICKSIDRNVCYICAVGQQHDYIHDLADEELAFRDVDNEGHHLPKHMIITVGDEDFEEGIWFGIYSTNNPETDVEKIIILDVTKEAKQKTMDLVLRFENGYIPE